MASDTGTKIAMFIAGLGAVDLAIAKVIPSLNFTITGFLWKYVPTTYQSYVWAVYAIYGIAGAYTIYKVFKK